MIDTILPFIISKQQVLVVAPNNIPLDSLANRVDEACKQEPLCNEALCIRAYAKASERDFIFRLAEKNHPKKPSPVIKTNDEEEASVQKFQPATHLWQIYSENTHRPYRIADHRYKFNSYSLATSSFRIAGFAPAGQEKDIIYQPHPKADAAKHAAFQQHFQEHEA